MDYRYEGGNDGLEHEDMHQDPSCDLLSCSTSMCTLDGQLLLLAYCNAGTLWPDRLFYQWSQFFCRRPKDEPFVIKVPDLIYIHFIRGYMNVQF